MYALIYCIVTRVIAAWLSVSEKTRRHYGLRGFEHLGLSLATGKTYTFNPNNSNNTAILNHINHTSCRGKEETFRITIKENV